MANWVKQTGHHVLKEIAGLVLVKMPLANEEIAAARMQTCIVCPQIDTELNRCKVCLCYLDKKTKSQTNIGLGGKVEITHCPLGNWGDKVIANMYRKIHGKEML